MPTVFILSGRKTHSYSDGWSHLDQWVPLHPVRALASRTVAHPSRQRTVHIQTFRLPPDLSPRKRARAAQALSESLTRSACRHDHDCCGCFSFTAAVVARRKREITLRVVGRRNV